ncbi:MAG TPA: dihydrofolate reductase family protein [Streptosporangiaceae bacterium]|jgi:dihydrofolate reductase|nr:dihydrofolate reductase family protein [Streptosporangiaceae bacterium]
MKLTVTTFLTLDGVMQAPGAPEEDPSEGFGFGGWMVPYMDDAEFGPAVDAWFATADAFLLGRKTYEIFAGYWPQVTDENEPVARALNSLPKYVASTTLDRVEWNNSTLLDKDVVAAVTELKNRPGRDLQVHGSGDLAQTLIENDLVDEFRLFIYPVVLGRGKRLFGAGTVPAALRLVGAKTTAAGVAVHTYERAGSPEFGTFSPDQ